MSLIPSAVRLRNAVANLSILPQKAWFDDRERVSYEDRSGRTVGRDTCARVMEGDRRWR